ncbi:MAG: NADH-quinone oxidoreductase subunit G [Gammaproteobacteria bacterium]|nr:NADH-quinone oxidoreductase subunit G [Gammaproteobacteria bacterium]
MSDKKITIEVDGQTLSADPGQMLIEVTDEAGIYIPRFCYHKKLSVAANCRMCLVEMENGRKPMPACATPVGDGNKFFTRSKAAIAAQRATMEFLLINHPLDCPICDQGGECELQDLAMGYGRGISRYTESKRAVEDKYLGPLVSTDMTRCIHCTRCVRFGQEIAGIQELGTIGRGENMEIAPYIEKTVDHELSGNIIDLCPVGALNNKPFRFRARSWEMRQAELVSPHDAFGSHLYGHVWRGKVMRVVPRDSESLNETWISDRDRYSCEGLYSDERLTEPMIRQDGEWRTTDWATALGVAASGIRKTVSDDPSQAGLLAAPWSTAEELYLIKLLSRSLGVANLDHRLRQTDFSAQQDDAAYPGLEIAIADIDTQDALLMLGCRPRTEVPMFAHRVRKAVRNGARVMIVNEQDDDYLFARHAHLVGPDLSGQIAALCQAAQANVSGELQSLVHNATVSDAHRQMVKALQEAEKGSVFLGHAAARHPQWSVIRSLASALAQACAASLNCMGEAANSAGAAMLGVLPHRDEGGREAVQTGKNVSQMFADPLKAYLLFGFEAENDCASAAQAVETLAAANHVVCVSSYLTEAMQSYANVILPLGSFVESAGTFVNCEGRWQSYTGAGSPLGEARPGWKILRVLGNTLECEGFDFNSAEEVLTAAQQAVGEVALRNVFTTAGSAGHSDAPDSGASPGLYTSDPVVRRSRPLQEVGHTAASPPLQATA